MTKRTKSARAALLALVMILPVLFLIDPATAYVDCSTDEVCDAGDSCELAAAQGSDDASSDYEGNHEGNAGKEQASANVVHATLFAERWIHPTCTNVSLKAYSVGSSGSSDVNDCQRETCRARTSYGVMVEDVEPPRLGSYCTASNGVYCDDYVDAQASATKSGIAVNVPNTLVVSQNCGYAIVEAIHVAGGSYVTLDEHPDECGTTNNYVGVLPDL